MPTGTDLVQHPTLPKGLTRRHALGWISGLLTAPMAAHAAAPQRALQLAAAWQQADGSYRIGVLAAPMEPGAPLTVLHALDVPTRAHGVHPLPDGSILATARRPGDWLVLWHPGRPHAEPVWHWVDPTRSFNGHVIGSPDGHHLYTTETDIDTGASLVARRDAYSLETVDEWATHGVDAHELLWAPAAQGSPQRTLIVANGGVPTAPETGRVKRDLHTMDSSIVRLDGSSGELMGQWRLQDPRLSLRHLAWNTDRTVLGIALQAEHDDAATKHSAPILALFDGQTLRVATAPQAVANSIHGYGGSIAATATGWAVSCPRADGIATFAPQGDWRGLVALPEVCALAVARQQLWAAGVAHSLQDALAQPKHHPHAHSLHGARMDNHWAVVNGNALTGSA